MAIADQGNDPQVISSSRDGCHSEKQGQSDDFSHESRTALYHRRQLRGRGLAPRPGCGATCTA